MNMNSNKILHAFLCSICHVHVKGNLLRSYRFQRNAVVSAVNCQNFGSRSNEFSTVVAISSKSTAVLFFFGSRFFVLHVVRYTVHNHKTEYDNKQTAQTNTTTSATSTIKAESVKSSMLTSSRLVLAACSCSAQSRKPFSSKPCITSPSKLA